MENSPHEIRLPSFHRKPYLSSCPTLRPSPFFLPAVKEEARKVALRLQE